jgi:hypothetical protein
MNSKKYLEFEDKGVKFFIEKDLVDGVTEEGGRIKVLMGDYGTWTIRIV